MKTKKFTRFISFVLILALFVQLVPAVAVETATEAELGTGSEVIDSGQPVQAEDKIYAAKDVMGEITARRSESEKHFRMADGSFVAVGYEKPVHYLDASGEYVDIDNTLVLKNSAGSSVNKAPSINNISAWKDLRYTNTAGEQSISFAASTAGKELISVKRDGYSISMSPLNRMNSSGPVMSETIGTAVMPMNPDFTIAVKNTEADVVDKVVDEKLPVQDETADDASETEAVPSVPSEDIGSAETETEESVPPAEEDTVTTPSEPIDPDTSVITPVEDEKIKDSLISKIDEYIDSRVTVVDKESLAWAVMPKQLDSNVFYSNVYPDVDLEYVLNGNDIKENIIIRKPLSDCTFDFELTLKNLSAQMTDEGVVEIVNSAGEPVYYMPLPHMYDAAGSSSVDVDYKLSSSGSGSYTITIIADSGWINDSARKFPVVIDPPLSEVYISNTGTTLIETSYISKSQPDTSFSYSTYNYVGYTSDPSQPQHLFRMLMRVNSLPALPNNSVVVDASVNYYNNGTLYSGIPNMKVCLYELSDNSPDYVGSNKYWVRQKSWNSVASAKSEIVDYATINSGSTFKKWDITGLVTSWYADANFNDDTLTSNKGFMFKAVNEDQITASTAANATFDGNTGTNKPYLLVNYRSTAGIEDYYTYQTQDIGRAGTGYVSDYGGQLTLVKEDLSSASTVAPFSLAHIYNSSYGSGEFGAVSSYAGTRYNRMKMGYGWKLSCQEIITEANFEPKPDETIKTDYLVYVDGDGTDHYFIKDGSYYYDEDGLGLHISKNSSIYYLYDRYGNVKNFYNGMLTYSTDANGNRIRYIYNSLTASESGTGWYPLGNGNDQLLAIRRQLKGGTSETIASFTYSGDRLASITDQAGGVTYYSYNGNYLTTVTHPDNTTAGYAYGGPNSKLDAATDNEAGYRVGYDFWSSYGKIIGIREYSVSGNTATLGSFIGANGSVQGRTLYRFCGADRQFMTDDDIIMTYLFDYGGRTVNIYMTDVNGKKIYGATAAAYEKGEENPKKNNRLSGYATIGVSAENLVPNGGIENSGGWTFTGSGSSGAVSSGVHRSGNKSLSIARTGSASSTSYYASEAIPVTAGITYTASAYVNTSEITDFSSGGVYLKFGTSDGEQLNWSTSRAGSDGWQRISVTYTPTSSSSISLYAYSGLTGTVYFDDFQVETNEAPSSLNLIDDGCMERQSTSLWTGNSAWFSYAGGSRFGTYSASLAGNPAEARSIYQDVQINRPSDKVSYMLSGWAKGNSVAAGDELNDKYFGLSADLYYSDGTTENFKVSFESDVTDWQFISTPILPKQTGKTVSYIRVSCVYNYNANSVCFDNIALAEASAQAYAYNDEGDLISADATDSNAMSYSYSGSDLTQMVSNGRGTFNYTYDTRHNLLTTKNDGVTSTNSYAANGNLLSTTITNSSNSQKITTSSTYDSGGSNGQLLAASTDSRGKTTHYGYANSMALMTGQTTAVTDANGTTVSKNLNMSNGRIALAFISGTVSLDYIYSKGQLTQLSRGGFAPGTTSPKLMQTYNLSYDDFGNLSSFKVGSQYTLASYAYASGNGNLSRFTYGNGQYVSYTYDTLDRITSAVYNNGTKYTYKYTGEGQLHSVTSSTGITYVYDYDSLGRLIGCSELIFGMNYRSGRFEYDKSNRLARYDYSVMGFSDRYYEYAYNSANGSLATLRTPDGRTFDYSYDPLHRLTEKDNGAVSVNYSYLSGSGANATTTMVSEISTKNASGSEIYGSEYTYDDVGNITMVINSDYSGSSYTYDNQNQLTRENISTNGRTTTYNYAYDTYGNIRSRTYSGSTDTFTYGDATWRDLLTAYNGNAITYDGAGNPTGYYDGSSFTWTLGRQLTTINKSNGTTIRYAYNPDGQRTSKSAGGVTHSYVWQNGKLLTESYSGTKLEFMYDENGSAFGIIYNGTPYYYVKNLQGDVLRVVDASGSTAASYSYDAWGRILSSSGTLASINPIRYRGYYYDSETGFYYLQSRYYDPEICRFINADSVLAGVGGSFQGYNLFAYCFNNPVNMLDHSGGWPKWIESAANWVNKNILIPVTNFFSPKTNTISGQFQDGIFRGSGSLTGGYSEFNRRLQVNSKGKENNGMLGGYGKVSVGNASGKIGIGNNNAALSLKGVCDGLTTTAQAGIQYKNGMGVAAKAKAAVLSGRATTELELFGWQIEFGVSGDFLSVGGETVIGVFPDEGFTTKVSVGTGLFGGGFVFRVKPKQ